MFVKKVSFRGHSKNRFVEEGRGVIEKRIKTNRGKFYSSSPVFPADYNGSMKY